MKNLVIVVLITILGACSGPSNSEGKDTDVESKEPTSTEKKDNGWTEATLSFTFGDKEYSDDVRFYQDEKGGLTVMSDKTDMSDSDGDGLIIALFQMGDNLQLDFVENGVRYGGKIADWEVGDIITGSGELNEEDDYFNKSAISFTITPK